ncbi:MAG: 30S ribosomal protein S6 [Candidatus Paceibacteria bacterium]
MEKVRTYEISFWIKGGKERAPDEKVLDVLKDEIESAGGQILKPPRLVRKILAYPIKKERGEGFFCLFVTRLPTQTITKLKEKFKRQSSILRFGIFSIPEKPELKLKPQKIRKKGILPPSKETGVALEELDKKLEEILKI